MADFLRSANLFYPPLIGNNNGICNFHGFFLIVSHKNTGHTYSSDHFLQPAPKLPAHLGINGGKRFIQQQQMRVRRKCPRKCHSLTLPSGQLMRISFSQILHGDQFQKFLHTLLDFRLLSFLYFQSKRNVICYCHISKQGIVLKHKSDATFTSRNVIHSFSFH